MAKQHIDTLDEALFYHYKKLPNFPFFRMVRPDGKMLMEQRIRFKKTKQPPIFTYPEAQKFPIENYLEALHNFKTSIGTHTKNRLVKKLYKEKVRELKLRAHIIQSIQKNNDAAVTRYAKKLFQYQPEKHKKLKKEQLTFLQNNTRKGEEKDITAKKLASAIRTLLDEYGIPNWNVDFHEGSSIKIARGKNRHAKILVPKKIRISKTRAAALLGHEIEGHALRDFNSIQAPIKLVRAGLANYIITEEGIALHIARKYKPTQPPRAPGFWEIYTIALREEFDFTETFDRLKELRQQTAEARKEPSGEALTFDAAWRLSTRMQRGIACANKPNLVYPRDHIYRTGFNKVQKELKTEQDWKDLYYGHIALEHKHLFPEERTDIIIPKFISEKILNK